MCSQTPSCVLPYLDYDIRSCQVAVLLGSDNPKRTTQKIKNKIK